MPGWQFLAFIAVIERGPREGEAQEGHGGVGNGWERAGGLRSEGSSASRNALIDGVNSN